MDGFHGFPPGELRTTPIPDVFFSHALPAISDSAELKVTLHIFWLCHRRRGKLRAVSHSELMSDATLRRSLLAEGDWQAAAGRALQAAVARGTLLEFRSNMNVHYAPNTAANRAAVAALHGEHVAPVVVNRVLPPLAAAPSSAAQLYEHYIGMVTPIIARELAEAEAEYPQQWLADAFVEAVSRDRRNWHYVQAILRGWASAGRR